MKKTFRKLMAWVLVICAMQCCLVPAVSAAEGDSVTYDFYTKYKSYANLYHWRTEDEVGTIAQSQVATDFASGDINWKIERGSGYANMVSGTILNGYKSYVSFNIGQDADCVFRIKSPGTGNYNVTLNYVTTNAEEANVAAEFIIIPATQDSYTSSELSALISNYRPQLNGISFYSSSWLPQTNTATMEYSFLEGQEYFFVVCGGPAYSGATSSRTYLQSLTASWIGEYIEPEVTEYPRPVTILEEALTLWDDGYCIATEVNGEDYLAVPINGGKMYIFNLDTWQLVDTVNTGISTPRGITVDDNGVIYLVGASYFVYQYDLKTNKPSKSSDVNISGVSLGSLYDISCGDDGMLYTGTDNGHIIRYNPSTDEVTAIFAADCGISNATYVSSVLQQGQYIYAAVTNKSSQHYLVKLDKDTFEVVGTVEYTSTKPGTYMGYMSITSDGIILGTANNLMAVDTETMTLLTAEEFGTSAQAQCYVSEAINGKHYYVSSLDRYMYCYDPQGADGNKVTKVSNVGQFFDCQGKAVTFDRDGDGVDEKYLIALENSNTSDIVFVNPETGASFKRGIQDLLPENAGAGTGINSLTNGIAGSNELYYGGFLSDEVFVYNTEEGKITEKIQASGIQTDAICVYNGNIYAGNYTEAQLTRLNRTTNKPDVLFTLHNSLFNQSRIHSIVAGDNKVFLGTFPYVYRHGGALAWYDYDEELTYVAVGPTASDVYYGKTFDSATGTSIAVGDVVWYQNGDTTKTPVTTLTMTGVVENQGIKDVAYHNGILYAASSRSGGTNTSPVAGTSAVVIAYDVAAKQVIATFDPTTQGFGSPVPTISGIEVDENGTLWCTVSETLFTLTLNEDNTFTYSEKLSFDKYSYDATQNRANSAIVFDGNGYVYAAFERIGGLCKINMTNPDDYTMLMPNVTSNGQVPNSFALGEDGNLYFLLGSALKMLTLNDTEEEWAAADAVTEQIAAITEETTSDVIAQIRADYNALTLREQSLVQNYSTLVQAEADALIADIDALGEITWEKKAQVEALLATYQAMPMSQQELVTNYYVLATANKELLMIESKSPVLVENAAGEKTYYQNLEDAVAEATEGTITLRENIAAEVVNVNANVVLDLNGYTLTVNSISGNVKDSADGKGLIKTGEKNAVLTAADDQLILWDNAADASGYRLFDYTFTNKGVDRNKNKDDAASSEDMGTTVKSFWSDLSFTNSYAYTLVGSTYAGLEVGFEVSWTPVGGETTNKTFALDAATIQTWADAEFGKTVEDYCFFVQLTGFEDLPTDGVVTVKPYAKTVFQTLTEVEATEYEHEYVEPVIPELVYEIGFGTVPAM